MNTQCTISLCFTRTYGETTRHCTTWCRNMLIHHFVIHLTFYSQVVNIPPRVTLSNSVISHTVSKRLTSSSCNKDQLFSL